MLSCSFELLLFCDFLRFFSHVVYANVLPEQSSAIRSKINKENVKVLEKKLSKVRLTVLVAPDPPDNKKKAIGDRKYRKTIFGQ